MLGRNLVSGLAAIVLAQGIGLAALSLPAQGQEQYPSKRFTMLVPYVAGAATDNFSRIIADGVSRQTGQPVVVINKTGALGMVAVRQLQATPADGYTFVLLAGGIVIDQVMKKNADFDIRRDLVPVVRAAQGPLGLFVSNALPVNSVKELIDYAKKNPGKVTYASSGVGSSVHLATERFKLATGIDMLHVPYPSGGGPINMAMMSGEIGVQINEMGSLRPFVTDKKFKVLATLGDQRFPLYPDTPAVSELGIPELRNFTAGFFYGVYVAPGTDNAKVEALATAINSAINEPATRERLVALGYSPALLGGTRPAEFRKILNEELARVEQVVRDARIPTK